MACWAIPTDRGLMDIDKDICGNPHHIFKKWMTKRQTKQEKREKAERQFAEDLKDDSTMTYAEYKRFIRDYE